MKLKIKINGEDKEIELRSLRGKQIKMYWNYLIRLSRGEDIIEEFLIFQDQIASELTGLNSDEIDELDIDEKQKILDIPKQKALAQIDFTKLSPNQRG